jgi:hypothetical protein
MDKPLCDRSGGTMSDAAFVEPSLSESQLRTVDRYWRAANYLSVGQIYLRDNPLLREPLKIEHIKPRLLGHWGTTSGLNFIYVHLNRLIKEHDRNAIYVTRPGRGGGGVDPYLEIEVDPDRNSRRGAVISPPDTTCVVRVIATDEEFMIARHMKAVLALN